jgi:hypothetical protein
MTLTILLAAPSLASTFPGPDAAWEKLSGGDPFIECTTVGSAPWCRSTGLVPNGLADVNATLQRMSEHQDLFDSIVRIDVLAPDTLHIVLDYPTGISDRDYVAKYTRSEAGDTVVYRWEPVVHAGAPETSDVVRLPNMAGEWRLSPAENGQTRVVYLWQADVLGSFPGFMLNKARTIAGTKALEDIRKATAAATAAASR